MVRLSESLLQQPPPEHEIIRDFDGFPYDSEEEVEEEEPNAARRLSFMEFEDFSADPIDESPYEALEAHVAAFRAGRSRRMWQ